MYTKKHTITKASERFYLDKLVSDPSATKDSKDRWQVKFVYPNKPESLPVIRDLLKNTDIPYPCTNYDNLVIKNKQDLATFKAYVKMRGIYLSVSNIKPALSAYMQGYSRPVAFGKTTIATCLYASEECKVSCYQQALHYRGSENCHLYNALIMANLTYKEIKQSIMLSLETMKPDFIRLLDNGDFSQPAEFKVWDECITEYKANNPDTKIRAYGYTKAGELIHMSGIDINDGSVVWNLSDNGDPASKVWADKLHKELNAKVCHIEYTIDGFDADIPFNNEEELASMTQPEMLSNYGTTVFQIGYHGFIHKETNKFFKELELTLDVQTC